eukprot:GILJ01003494.1.p1 GENE.GILJ01003494.1~~GILJ01003494.1.p1  ORF type:complete len:425 (+),score=54.97 GILJ01003494.1:215-1489(+)
MKSSKGKQSVTELTPSDSGRKRKRADSEGDSAGRKVKREAMEKETTSDTQKKGQLSFLCRYLLKMYLHGDHVLSMDKVCQQLDISPRRLYDVLNILEGVGLVARMERKQYKWEGLSGMATAFRGDSGPDKSQRSLLQKQLYLTDVKDEEDNDDTTSRKNLSVLGYLGQQFVRLLLHSDQRTVTLDKAGVELFGETERESRHSRRLYDIVNILSAVGLVERFDVNGRSCFRWKGPLINDTAEMPADRTYFKSCLDNSDVMSELSPFQDRPFRGSDEPTVEYAYKSVKESKPPVTQFATAQFDIPSLPDGDFEKVGFAKLQGSAWTCLVRKCHTILGRASRRCATARGLWQVDVDLGTDRRVSRQHAVISFNFETRAFEIRCLSKLHSIQVNGKQIRREDGPVALSSRSLIRINDELMYFLLPKKS